jgi:hypothetical protein
MSTVQVQADGYLGAAKLLDATVKAFVSSASRLRVTEPGAYLTFGAMYYGLGAGIRIHRDPTGLCLLTHVQRKPT